MSNVFYPYLVYLSGGNAIQAYRQEEDEMKLWESVKILKEHPGRPGFIYFYINKEHNIVPGIADPYAITSIERPFGTGSIDLDERKKQIEEIKNKIDKNKTRVGSTAIDITQRK